MTERLNSKQLNNIMINAISEIENVKENYNNIEKDMLNKMNILQIENAYREHLLSQQAYHTSSNKLVFVDSTMDKFGEYDTFGHTVHPKIDGFTVDMFNSQFEDKVLYKNNALIKVNDSESSSDKFSYKNYLMHENVIGKKHQINRYKEDKLSISIDLYMLISLGSTIINTIEIDPFLQGSFDIERIRIYKADGDSDFVELGSMKNITKSRILLDGPTNFHKAVIDIKLNYKDNNDFYLFGLKSLRFLHIPYKRDSYIVAKLESSDNIRSIGNNIKLTKARGISETTIYDEGIKLFLDNNEGLLSYEIEPGITGKTQDIARNVNTIYLKVPVRESITSVTLHNINSKVGI